MVKWFNRKKRDQAAIDEQVADQGLAVEDNLVEAEQEAEAELDLKDGIVDSGEEELDADDSAFTLSDGEETPDEAADRPRRRYFQRLRERLHKTRENFAERVDRIILGKKTIDADLLDDLEEVLITSDLGVKTSQILLQKTSDKIKRQELKNPEKLREHLRDEIRAILSVTAAPGSLKPTSHASS